MDKKNKIDTGKDIKKHSFVNMKNDEFDGGCWKEYLN